MGEIRIRVWTWVAALFTVPGILACIYFLYDLRFPNRFVGDMYGLEVICRLTLLCAAAAPMVLGAVLLSVGWRRNSARLHRLGAGIMIASSLLLMFLSVDVALSRRQNEIRKGYPQKSTEELLAIARDQKDQHALDALMAKADPAAVPGLALILLDKSQPGNLRFVAAQALARIGGKDARAALEKARDNIDDAQFKEYLEVIIQQIKSKP